MDALICSVLAFSGSLNRRRNLPLLRSTLCLAPLAADLEHVDVLDLHLHLLLQPWDVGLEHVGLRGLLPVAARAGERRSVGVSGNAREEAAAAGAEGEALEGIPEVEGERVEHVAAADQRHGR